jgi:uncharacterized membrane protein YjjB (DUF3815 family)
MTDWANIIFKAFWCGWAATGFGILFNVPPRTLIAIWSGGALTGLIKFSILYFSAGSAIIFASFIAALFIGIASIPIAHLRHVPPMVFAIPSVIPLIPGVYAYRTMIGLVQLKNDIGTNYSVILSATVHNGVITSFIIMSIAMGVAIPMHVMRKESVKKLRFTTIKR